MSQKCQFVFRERRGRPPDNGGTVRGNERKFVELFPDKIHTSNRSLAACGEPFHQVLVWVARHEKCRLQNE